MDCKIQCVNVYFVGNYFKRQNECDFPLICKVTGEIKYRFMYNIKNGRTLSVNDDFACVNYATMEIGYPEHLTKTDREMQNEKSIDRNHAVV